VDALTPTKAPLLFTDFLSLGLVWFSQELGEAGQIGFGWRVSALTPLTAPFADFLSFGLVWLSEELAKAGQVWFGA
jgi:hypothetical protein